MGFKGFIKRTFSSKKQVTVLLVCAAYISAAIGIYYSSFAILHYKTLEYSKKTMQQTLNTIVFKINYQTAKNYIFMKNLSASTSVKWPMALKMYDQMKLYLDNISGEADNNILILTNTEGKVIYENRKLYNSTVDYPISENSYIAALSKDTLYFHFYFPISSEGKLCGSISSVYSIENFKGMINESLESLPFIVFTIYDGNISSRYTGQNSSTAQTRHIKYAFFSPITASSEQILTGESHEAPLPFKASGIAIGLPVEAYEAMVLNDQLSAVYITAAALIIFTLAAFAAFLLLQRYKKFTNKMKAEIETLRIQSHDFIKHVSIVNALAIRNDTEELKKYVSSLNDVISLESALLRLNNSPVSILLSQKEKSAIRKNISFDLNARSSLDSLKMRSSELCTLLGNLIDNAIDASEKLPEVERFIEVDIYEDRHYKVVKVSNKGEAFKLKNIDKLFEYGYTTKPDKKHHGMGLYIVSQIVRKYDGSIEVQDGGGIISFAVYLPYN